MFHSHTLLKTSENLRLSEVFSGVRIKHWPDTCLRHRIAWSLAKTQYQLYYITKWSFVWNAYSNFVDLRFCSSGVLVLILHAQYIFSKQILILRKKFHPTLMTLWLIKYWVSTGINEIGKFWNKLAVKKLACCNETNKKVIKNWIT